MAMLVYQRSAGINFGSAKLCTEWFAKFGWKSPSFKVGEPIFQVIFPREPVVGFSGANTPEK